MIIITNVFLDKLCFILQFNSIKFLEIKFKLSFYSNYYEMLLKQTKSQAGQLLLRALLTGEKERTLYLKEFSKHIKMKTNETHMYLRVLLSENKISNIRLKGKGIIYVC